MLAKNCTQTDLERALELTNTLFDGNIKFRNIGPDGKNIRFTLTVKDSHAPGARLGFPDYSTGKQKHLAAACWHVHGYFFKNLIDACPDARIITRVATIDKDGGNWQDENIGSAYRPLRHSEACECPEDY